MGGVSETTTNKNRFENKINKEGLVYRGIPEIITKTENYVETG